jgi:hypothetical protein
VKAISNPVIKLQAVRQLAQRYLNTDPQDFGRAIAFADLVDDPAQRSAVRAEVLARLAELGFADAALPEAKTALQKAALARRMAATDDEAKKTARQLMVDAAKELPALPKAVADAVRLELTGAKVNLTLTDGPAEAIVAIEALPASAQTEMWEDLTGWCLSRKDSKEALAEVMKHVTDRALRRKLEIESLLMHLQLRPPEELIAECRADAEAAASPAAKVTALISLAEAQRNAEASGLNPPADGTLRAALAAAGTISNPAERCRALISLARKFCDAPLLGEARPILEQAAKDVSQIESLTDRIAVLILASEESYKESDETLAVKLMEDAVKLVNSAPQSGPPPDAASLEALALAVLRRGDWPRGLALIDRIPDEAARAVALDNAAARAAEDSMSMDPAHPPPRGAPVDDIRRQASGDDAKATALVEEQPAGYARARAWLAMAKGLIGPPTSLPANAPSNPVELQGADSPAKNDARSTPRETPESKSGK